MGSCGNGLQTQAQPHFGVASGLTFFSNHICLRFRSQKTKYVALCDLSLGKKSELAQKHCNSLQLKAVSFHQKPVFHCFLHFKFYAPFCIPDSFAKQERSERSLSLQTYPNMQNLVCIPLFLSGFSFSLNDPQTHFVRKNNHNSLHLGSS